MPVSPQLLALLRCPETQQRLAPAPAEILLERGLTEALLTEDGRRLYPVQNGIPILLPEAMSVVPAVP